MAVITRINANIFCEWCGRSRNPNAIEAIDSNVSERWIVGKRRAYCSAKCKQADTGKGE